MPRDIDAFQLIRSFAQRNSLSELEYRPFAEAVQRQARLSDQSVPVFRDLCLNPDLVLVPRLFLLAKDRKISLSMAGNQIRSIILPERYEDAFLQEYKRIEENPDIPFPDEDSLKVIVPGEWIQSLNLDTDLATASEPETEPLVPLYRIVFSNDVRPLVVPSSFVPNLLLEHAVLKIRQYLRKGGNKDFMQNKLLVPFSSKEGQLKEALNAVMTKPTEAIAAITESGSEFTFSFWAYLVSAIKKDLDKKTDKAAEDWATDQAALICEFYANYYRGKAQRLIDLEAALKCLDQGLRKPPYYYTLDEIVGFKDSKGLPLLGVVGREDIESRLRDRCIKAERDRLPDILVVAHGSRRVFVAKDRILLLALRQVAEARSDLRARLLEAWRALLEDYRSCEAMQSDEAFRQELVTLIEARFPVLASLLNDRLLPLVHEEARTRGDAPPELDRLFYKGDMAPIDELLELQRKTLLVDAKMLLPFWYSVPILRGLARFFRRLSQGAFLRRDRGRKAKPRPKAIESSASAAPEIQTPATDARRAEFAAAAAKVAKDLTPSGYSLEEYLVELEGRWNTQINPQSKRDLAEDVQSLVRDYLRGILRTMRGSTFTLERVRNLASTLADSPSLLRITNHQALEQYIQLYMVKILCGSKPRVR